MVKQKNHILYTAANRVKIHKASDYLIWGTSLQSSLFYPHYTYLFSTLYVPDIVQGLEDFLKQRYTIPIVTPNQKQ